MEIVCDHQSVRTTPKNYKIQLNPSAKEELGVNQAKCKGYP